jgi:hypothetical protein
MPILLRHSAGGECIVARDHHNADSGIVDGFYHGTRIITHGVFQTNQTGEAQLTFDAHSRGEHALSSRGNFLRHRLPFRFWHAAELSDSGRCALM